MGESPRRSRRFPPDIAVMPATDAGQGNDLCFCVVVKVTGDEAFVLTGYLTYSVKKGVRIWPRSA